MARFQMQSWEGEDGWEPMEQGAAGHVWKPRQTAVEAAAKCVAWTGFVGIPAMQVVDLHTGRVVWRDSHRYPAAGECVELPDEALVSRTAEAILAGKPEPPPPTDQGALF